MTSNTILIIFGTFLLFYPLLSNSDNMLRFLLLGDWGKGGKTGKYGSSIDINKESVNIDKENFVTEDSKPLYQVQVANAMGNFSSQAEPSPSFVVALGDNFYTSGVSSSSDKLWDYLWKDIYLGYDRLNIPWYAVFGNHDYGGGPSSVQAQIDRYHAHVDDDIWMLPSTNYSVRFNIPNSNGSVMIIFVDTTTLAPSVNQCCNENG